MEDEIKKENAVQEDTQINTNGGEDYNISQELQQLRAQLEETKRQIILEKNARLLSKHLISAGIRPDRVDVVLKLVADKLDSSIDDASAMEIARKIANEYPEFCASSQPVSVDQSRPGGAVRPDDPLEILRQLRGK
ncbi:hypothetical protein J7K99_03280 [bacterium]|nr:hypothetical protein [bacterium]